MFNSDKIIDIFYIVHEFCIEFDKAKSRHVLTKDNGKSIETVLLTCMTVK